MSKKLYHHRLFYLKKTFVFLLISVFCLISLPLSGCNGFEDEDPNKERSCYVGLLIKNDSDLDDLYNLYNKAISGDSTAKSGVNDKIEKILTKNIIAKLTNTYAFSEYPKDKLYLFGDGDLYEYEKEAFNYDIYRMFYNFRDGSDNVQEKNFYWGLIPSSNYSYIAITNKNRYNLSNFFDIADYIVYDTGSKQLQVSSVGEPAAGKVLFNIFNDITTKIGQKFNDDPSRILRYRSNIQRGDKINGNAVYRAVYNTICNRTTDEKIYLNNLDDFYENTFIFISDENGQIGRGNNHKSINYNPDAPDFNKIVDYLNNLFDVNCLSIDSDFFTLDDTGKGFNVDWRHWNYFLNLEDYKNEWKSSAYMSNDYKNIEELNISDDRRIAYEDLYMYKYELRIKSDIAYEFFLYRGSNIKMFQELQNEYKGLPESVTYGIWGGNGGEFRSFIDKVNANMDLPVSLNNEGKFVLNLTSLALENYLVPDLVNRIICCSESQEPCEYDDEYKKKVRSLIEECFTNIDNESRNEPFVINTHNGDNKSYPYNIFWIDYNTYSTYKDDPGYFDKAVYAKNCFKYEDVANKKIVGIVIKVYMGYLDFVTMEMDFTSTTSTTPTGETENTGLNNIASKYTISIIHSVCSPTGRHAPTIIKKDTEVLYDPTNKDVKDEINKDDLLSGKLSFGLSSDIEVHSSGATMGSLNGSPDADLANINNAWGWETGYGVRTNYACSVSNLIDSLQDETQNKSYDKQKGAYYYGTKRLFDKDRKNLDDYFTKEDFIQIIFTVEDESYFQPITITDLDLFY